ncbi:MAG: carboxypeptidase regulatory-like domain-containing protein [Bacteroidaceae bacterium]|nr:carboxypeptidase regulatory-like domain-containing protein [Bacteroidaceae bacterium]
MKKLFLLTGLLMASLIASAQQVVSGTVTDKDGNPIPGAKVEIVGSTESCITELDGTYSIETTAPAKKVRVQYAGMQTAVKKIKPDMVVELSNTNWWNAKPDKYRWLLSVQGAFPEAGVSNPSLGLMVGRVKNIGWYVKGVYSPRESAIDYYSGAWTTGKDTRSFIGATGGVIFRLGSPFHLYVGGGYATRQVAWELANGKYMDTKDLDLSYDSPAIDLGIMMKLGNFMLNAGTMLAGDGESPDFVGNFGIGYCF